MTLSVASAALLAAGPLVERIEPWKVVALVLAGALLASCVLYVVVRFGRPGAER